MIGPPLVAVALLVGLLLLIPLANGLFALRWSRRDDAAFREHVDRPFDWSEYPDL